MALSITVHGRPTCEDTALARERLRALGIPFHETNVDIDPVAAAIVERLNEGQRVTPTIVFGDEAFVVVEPTIKMLDAALKRAGHTVGFAHMFQFGPPTSERAAPGFSLPSVDGPTIRLDDYRQRKFLIVAVASAPHSDQALAGLRTLNEVYEVLTVHHAADAIAIVAGRPGDARAARAQAGAHVQILDDAEGSVTRKYDSLHERLQTPAVFVLDRYGAPRAAGPLTPLHVTEAVAWIEFIECECDE
jgi:peroxiredoxin/glutaredoxin